MYRNAVYNGTNQTVTLFTWDEDGNRIVREATHEPYIYVEDPKGDKSSIYDTKVRKRSFRNSYERNKFINDSGIKRVYENLQAMQQYLIDTYWQDNEKEEFTKFDIKTTFIDIETYSVDGFPDVDNPTHTVNAITCYDSLTKMYNTFGLKPCGYKQEDVIYTHCSDECELFIKFIEYIEEDFPDILSGWNSEFFDIPYILNRCERILGEEYTQRLSPLKRVTHRVIRGKFGNEQKRYYIDGVSCIDYLDIYKKFCYTMRETYKLDAIAEIELGENKIDFGDTDLATLSDTDWDKFIEYNIHDVRLLVMLEEKLQYISLLRMLAYVGLTTFEGALGSVSLLTGAMTIKARLGGRVMSTFVRTQKSGKNPGAYVSTPNRGFQTSICTFDAASLYPSVMMSLNMSPETKVGRFEKNAEGNFEIYHTSGKMIVLPPDKFAKFIKAEKCCLSKANIIFTQKKRGIVPLFLDDYFQRRQEIKKKLFNVEKELRSADPSSREASILKDRVSRMDTKQLVIKILINSLYGVFGNKHASFGDDEIASSVTLTGQAIIKQSNTIIEDYIANEISDLTSAEKDKVIIYNDTDSCFISIQPYVDRGMVTFSTDGVVHETAYKKLNEIESDLNNNINKWVKSKLLSVDPRFNFKREKICDVGCFLQKKRYVLRILDNEGVKVNKFKYTGVEVVRSTMPNTIKPYAKHIIETMLESKSLHETNKLLNEAYDKFKTLTPSEIAFVTGIKNYEAYAGKCKGLQTVKGMPVHVKSAYYHNFINKEIGINNKIEDISSGDKIRFVYLQKPNKYNIESIGFKYSYIPEFDDLFDVDYEKMFEKILFNTISRFYESVDWQIRKPTDNVQTELFDLFS
jgi:DNA polymerase elongation subunit (family B)